MAIAEHLDLQSEQFLTQAFFALHEPLKVAVHGEDQHGIEATLETARALVVDAIAVGQQHLSVVARDEVRQLGWVTSQATNAVPEDVTVALAEWDHLLEISVAAAAARNARTRSAELRQTLAARIVDLLADDEMRPAEIATSLGATRAHVSRALRQLREDDMIELVTARAGQDKRGSWYRRQRAQATA